MQTHDPVIVVSGDKFPFVANRTKGSIILPGCESVITGANTVFNVDTRASFPIAVYFIFWTMVNRISDKDVEWFGFESRDEVLAFFQREHPELTTNSLVTVIRFWNDTVFGSGA